MKKNIIRISASLLLLAGVTGCDSFLDTDKDNVYTETELNKRAKRAEGVLLTAYSNLPSSVNFTDAATEDAVYNLPTNAYYRIGNGEWSASYTPITAWDSYYTQIAYLNHFIVDIVDKTTWSASNEWKNEHFRTRLKGEAHGLRAYYYLQLLQAAAGPGAVSGEMLGVPMPLAPGRETLPRKSFQACVDQILLDVQAALDGVPDLYANVAEGVENSANLNAVYGANFKNRMCGRVAKMIRARVLLLAASPAFNPTNDLTKWAAAADAAAEVIDAFGGLSALAATRLDYYLNANNAEHLWRKDATTASYNWEENHFPPSFFGKGGVNPSQNLIDAFPAVNGYPISDVANSGYVSSTPYTGRDPRLDKYVIHNGTTFKSTVINTVDGVLDGVGKVANSSTRTGYYALKFMNPGVALTSSGTGQTGQPHMVTLMRYTEAYLIYAEAANRAWGPDGRGTHAYSAREVIARMRSTAGITGADPYLAAQTTTDAFEQVVRNERRLEMCLESVRFWDVRRWSDLTAMKTAARGTLTAGVTSFEVETRPYQDYQIYGPIPDSEVRKGLEQNAGW